MWHTCEGKHAFQICKFSEQATDVGSELLNCIHVDQVDIIQTTTSVKYKMLASIKHCSQPAAHYYYGAFITPAHCSQASTINSQVCWSLNTQSQLYIATVFCKLFPCLVSHLLSYIYRTLLLFHLLLFLPLATSLHLHDHLRQMTSPPMFTKSIETNQ